MSLTRVLVLLTILAPLALAQNDDQTYHDVTISFGNLDIDEDAGRFLAIMNDMNSGVTTQPTFFDMSEEVLRLTETMHLGKHFAVSGRFGSFGESTIQTQNIPTNEDETATTYTLRARFLNLEMEAVGKLPLFGGNLVAYAGVGANFNSTRFTLRDETAATERGAKKTGLVGVYSAGLYSVIAKKFVLRLDYTKSKLQQVDTTTTTLGIGFRYQ